MSVAVDDATSLDPIISALDAVRARHGEAPVHGVTRSLLLPRRHSRWIPASRFADGSALPDLLASASLRWPGGLHVAGALAWKSYAYWVMLPAVVGFATARRVPDLSAGNTLVRIHGVPPFVEMSLARPDVFTGDDARLLAALRDTVMAAHLDPVLDRLRATIRVGRRTLLGSVASAVCYALLRASDVLPGSAVPPAMAILDALGLADLVDFGPDSTGRLTVTRRTCCLGFALPEPRVCSGCCIPADRQPPPVMDRTSHSQTSSTC